MARPRVKIGRDAVLASATGLGVGALAAVVAYLSWIDAGGPNPPGRRRDPPFPDRGRRRPRPPRPPAAGTGERRGWRSATPRRSWSPSRCSRWSRRSVASTRSWTPQSG